MARTTTTTTTTKKATTKEEKVINLDLRFERDDDYDYEEDYINMNLVRLSAILLIVGVALFIVLFASAMGFIEIPEVIVKTLCVIFVIAVPLGYGLNKFALGEL